MIPTSVWLIHYSVINDAAGQASNRHAACPVVSGSQARGIMTLAQRHREVASLRKIVCRWSVAISLLLILQTCWSIAKAQTEETKPVFELDCVNFEGRSLAKAPVKKKAYPSLAADGTAWSIAPDTKHVTITRIFEGEAAAKAGLEPGDEIISVNGYSTEGAKLGELICFYHMYEPSTLTETLVVKKKDGSEQTLALNLLTLDKCNAEEKRAWLDIYKGLGY
jgi:hypothetical protein